MAQLQNIPSRNKPNEYDARIQKLGPKIRRMFVAPPADEFAPEGYDLIDIDLSQLELRLGAHFTCDPTLLKVYGEKVEIGNLIFFTGDIHNETSVRMKVPRKLAKSLNFGLMYGMGAENFAVYSKLYIKGTKQYNIPAATMYVNDFRSTYAGVFQYHDEIRDAWYGGQRSFEMISGRLRHFPKDARVSAGTVYNSKIQGSAADVMKVHLWAIDAFIMKNPMFSTLTPLIQVHDEFIFQVRKSMAQAATVAVKYVMEYPWFNTIVPLMASAKICQAWSEKDDDYVPEVGTFYAKIDGEDQLFNKDNWRQYAEIDEADKERKDNPRITRRACVAVLSNRQKEWARSLLPETLPMFGSENNGFVLQSVEEYMKEKEHDE